MRPIRGRVNTLEEGAGPGRSRARRTVAEVAAAEGIECCSFDDLQDVVAQIGYYNPHHDIFLRGQSADYRDANGYSALNASLFRVATDEAFDGQRRLLDEAEGRLLAYRHNRPGITALRQFQWARWAILQHYEKAQTPLLDVTRSPRIAASFATLGGAGDAFVYLLGLPYPNGNLTHDLATETVIANLRNLMPPDARRPHWQQGYLVGSYPNETLWQPVPRRRSDRAPAFQWHNAAQRLLAKVRIPASARSTFWPADNPALPAEKLLPAQDPVRRWLDDVLDGHADT